MKTTLIKRLGLAILGMLVMGFALANETQIRVLNEKKILLRMENVSENAILVIRELNGPEFYSEKIKISNETYVKLFDLTNLPDGKYVVELEESMKFISYEISLVHNKICSTGIVKYETFKPTILEKGAKVYVSNFNLDNRPLSINIYDSNDELVSNETLVGNVDLGKIYDFSNVSGKFRIEMSRGDKTFSQIVSINE
jgi:hypothetical protein